MDEQDLLRKISGLLAKAEGTDNEHEANAFFEKAQELMVRHAIDEARVREAQVRINGRAIEEPVVEDYMFSSYAHHASAKQILFDAVAKANSVRTFHYSNQKFSNDRKVAAAGKTGLYESQWIKLVGYKTDIEMVKLLYLSLLIQSQKFATDDWRTRYGEAKHSAYEDGHIGKFSWLSSHMEGFAYRISQRFREVNETVYRTVLDGTELIVAKDANIQEWMYEHGIMSRPKPVKLYCWAVQPETDPGWPRTKAGKPNKKWQPLACIIELSEDGSPHEGPHAYTYRSPRYKSSYYVTKGRRESYEAGSYGRAAADRADIGLSRVGSASRALKG